MPAETCLVTFLFVKSKESLKCLTHVSRICVQIYVSACEPLCSN